MKKFTVLISYLLSATLFGQTLEVVTSDRPGQTFSAHTVGKSVFQIQSGFGYDQLVFHNVNYVDGNFENQTATYRNWTLYNVTNLRYGIIEPLEAGLTVISTYNDFVGEEPFLNTSFEPENNYDAYLSLRYNLLATQNWALGLRASGLLSLKELNLRAMASYKVSPDASVNSNIAYRLSSVNGRFNNLSYTLNFSQGLGKVGFFLETFAEIRLHEGDFHETDWQNFFDGGLFYLVNDNLQLDFSVGTGFNDQFFLESVEKSSRFFVDIGFTYRIK